ncbi:S-layer homology domain-containing protein [Paenibacillus radicis (ex Gao et al. 2016)]|nr:S-layer homology domain-containing protein [Paenibacillus radicis (ex Gao et al. 2016)]
MTAFILVLILVLSYFPVYPAEAAPLGTVTFTSAAGFSGSTITAGQGGSTAIPGMTLQIISGDGYDWTYEQPYSRYAVAAGYDDNLSASLMTIKSSNPATNFDFQSFFVADSGGGPITVTGYDNGISTGSVNLDTTQNDYENTFSQSNGLTASIFQNVDEIRITPQNEDMWIALNDIQIGSPIPVAPLITSQPSNSTISAGANTTFSVTATNATGYQWQVNQGAGFTNIANGASYSGATTATLTITGATAGMNGYQYRVVATGDATPNALSNSVTLTVNSPPSITAQPSSSTISAGANTTFAVTASNATGYQWQVNQGAGFMNIANVAPYSGATTATLTITGATAGMNGYQYRVVVTGAATPNAVSNSATLTVNLPPSITAQPSSSAISTGANTTFAVTATNATGYQWQVDQGAGFMNIANGAPYSGATTATLTITGATAGMNGYLYRVVVTGAATPNAVSNNAALTVNSPPSITSQPSSSTISTGGNTAFSVTATNATGYQWQVDQGAGFMNIANGAPYSGATTATLTITGATAGMNGYLYRVVVTGAATPNAVSNNAALTVNSPPSITSQPSSSTISAGGNTAFSVTATNATGYQWQVDQGAGFTNITNGAQYGGATTATLTITGATAGMNGYVYRVIATGVATPAAVSNSVMLTVNSPPSITSQPSNSTITAGGNTTFSVSAANVTGYQWQVDQGAGFTNISNGAPYSGATTATLTITGASAGMSGYLYRVVVTGAATPAATSNNAVLTVNTPPSITSQPSSSTISAGGNTAFSVTATNATGYQWQVDEGAGFTNISNGAPYSGATTATLTITGATAGMNGYLYRVVVTGAATPTATSNNAVLTVNTPPSITSQPSNSTITAGANTTFSVSAANATGYQWQVDEGAGFTNISNGASYSGATTATLTITGATAGMNGYVYRVIATGVAAPAAVSNSATLTVNTPPSITSQPSNSTISAGANTTFSVTATNATGYQWQVDEGAGFTNIANGAPYSGATTATLTITGATAGMNGYLYRVVATGAATPNAVSNSATLTVNTVPDAPIVTSIVAGDKQVHLVWNSVADSTGYKIYQSDISGAYGAEVATVGHSVQQKDITGLTNGTTYYFIVKAVNSVGDSDTSNEVSAKPVSVPAAPTNITAVAGDGQATITFQAPANNGGSAITGYEVTASPGNTVITGTASPITFTGLSNGTVYTFTVKAINEAGSGAASGESNAVTPKVPSNNSNSGSSGPSAPVSDDQDIDASVNGKGERIGTATTKKVNGQTVTTVAIDQKKLQARLESEGIKARMIIRLNAKPDVFNIELNGQMIKDMESKRGTIEIQTTASSYVLDAEQIDLDALSERLGKPSALQDVKIRIEIAAPTTETMRIVDIAAAKENFKLVVPPVNFTIKAEYAGSIVEVSKFNTYVERSIALPNGVDGSKITTGVVIEADGSVRHVPTKVITKESKHYAVINSLTNSTYAVIWHPLEFQDVANHWAKNAVNNMGSRMVIDGVGDGKFNPDRDITRAEFTAILVRGLGLKLESEVSSFSDVNASAWYSSAINTAYAYKLINGFEDGTFRPDDKITREEATVIIAKAMQITGLKQKLNTTSIEESLRAFTDRSEASEWARSSIADSLQAVIITGRSATVLAPKALITRAEVAVIIERLLQKSDLI